MANDKKIDYKTIAELKALLVDTIRAENYDIPLQASKVLAYIYGNEERKELAGIFNSKVDEFKNLMQKRIFQKVEKFYYERIKTLLENQNIKIILTYDYHRFTKIPFEYTDFITHLYESISKSKKYFENLNNNKNFDVIDLGIFDYYSDLVITFIQCNNMDYYIYDNYKTTEEIENARFIQLDIKPIYDYYYLKQKCLEQIDHKYNYCNETILLKVATIKVLRDFINVVSTKGLSKEEKENLARKENYEELVKFFDDRPQLVELIQLKKANSELTYKDIAKAMNVKESSIKQYASLINLKMGQKKIELSIQALEKEHPDLYKKL